MEADKKDMSAVQSQLVTLVNSGDLGKVFFSQYIKNVVSTAVSKKMNELIGVWLKGEGEVSQTTLDLQTTMIMTQIQAASSQQQ